MEAARRQTRHRVASLMIYAALLAVVQYLVVSTGFTPDENAIWLYSGFASLLFGSRLLNPHFTPPADAATNAFMALAALIAGSLVVAPYSADAALLWGVIALYAAICIVSVLVLLIRPPIGAETRPLVRLADKAVRGLGSPIVVFTIVILLCVWLFHRTRADEVVAILSAWAVIVILRPVESVLGFMDWAGEQWGVVKADQVIGAIAAYQSPGIVLVRQLGDNSVPRGTPMVVADNNGPWMLGVALNYVGRDEGNLLRVLTVRLAEDLKSRISKLPKAQGTGIALALSAAPEELADVPAIQRISRLCGVVVSDTNLDYVLFEVTEDRDLAEGRLVQARIGDHHVIFQIIDGLTREEIVQQKNTYGYARAKARKIGRWDAEAEKFVPVKWLPRINAPVFLLDSHEHAVSPGAVGHFPSTNFGVGLNISDTVTHNTAILGILGIGKSYLSIELVERMIADGIKVICLDLTDQYAKLLSEFLDDAHEKQLDDELQKAGGRGKAEQNREEGGTINQFSQKLAEQLRAFVVEDGRNLRVLNPAAFDVWRQTGFKDYKTGDASMASLTPTEITAIISDAALTVCQELGMIDRARVCLIYEEAHSLVPEWNSVVAEGDKAATARSARAILQGRKYGLGCLLITQRTANVTKTILNQCNTIFAMRTFDDTGKEFLSNYIGRDYAGVLPSLEARHAVVFGKASSCENPVLVRLNDHQPFLDAFRAAHPVQPLPAAPAPQDEPEPAEQANEADDQIPF
ncbi:MAG: ATP-binding protein [Rhizobiaceae bacterium]